MTDALRRPLAKAMLALSCVVLCAACRDEPSDPGATGRPAAVDLFSAWPGDESFRIAAEPSLVVGADESLPLGRVTGAVFFGDGHRYRGCHVVRSPDPGCCGPAAFPARQEGRRSRRLHESGLDRSPRGRTGHLGRIIPHASNPARRVREVHRGVRNSDRSVLK